MKSKNIKMAKKSYEELDWMVSNLGNLFFKENKVNLNEYFNKVVPDIEGSMIHQLKYWWIIRGIEVIRDEKLKQLGI